LQKSWTDEEIHERAEKFDPCIPIAWYWSRDHMDELDESWQKEIACISFTNETLNYALESAVHIMKTDRGLYGLSHNMARYAL